MGKEFDNLTEEDMCDLMCGKPEEEPYEFNWIDVEDMLPTKSGDYLVTTKNGFVQVAKWGYGLYKSGGWNGHCKNCIIAWSELPKPYVRY